MLPEILETCIAAWIRVKKEKQHPFRFFTLSTVDVDNHPQSRMVVLRDFDREEMLFTIFTDARSKKIAELMDNTNVQLLFYDSKKLFQVIVSAKYIPSDKESTVYVSLPDMNKKDYASISTPGDMIKSPETLEHNFDQNYFKELSFKAYKIETLRLKRPNHIRTSFNEINGEWKGVFLAP